MNRSLLLSILIYGLVILGLATLRGQLLALAIPFVLYLGASLLYGPQKIALTASRSLSTDRMLQGDSVLVTLSITNQGPELEELLLEHVIPAGLALIEGEVGTLVSLQTGETLELEYTLTGQRGLYRLPGIQATACDLMGLFTKQSELELSDKLIILPQSYKLPQVAIRPQRTRVYAGLIPARRGGPGVEFFELREYQPGDPLRWINHRASMRYEQTLFVNQFEQERAADVGLILDLRRVSNLYINKETLLEYSIQATATLADAFLNQGNRVGLVSVGGFIDWTFPGYGKLQRERILQALAKAQMQDHQLFQKLEHLPTRLFPIRSQLVLISPLLPTDLNELLNLRGRGYALLIITPDPIAFEEKHLGEHPNAALAVRLARLERTHLFKKLRQAGIRIVEWQVEKPFHQVAQHALKHISLRQRG
jgi:uncharacterized protein (DUF58 family)